MTPEFIGLVHRHFFSFVRKAFWETHGERLKPREYILFVCYNLAQLAGGEIKRLVINLPPRHLKTFVASICLAAWVLGNRPSAKILIVTYSERLADRIAFGIREIMQSRWYKKIFDTRLSAKRTQVGDFVTTAGGGVYAASIDGSLTGFGADFILVDDPLDIKYAGDVEKNVHVNERFDNLVRTRLNNQKKGRIAIIQHRLSENDLSQHVLEEGGWRRVVLPCLARTSRSYDCGEDGVYFRKKNSPLRPDAFSSRNIRKLEESLINPDFEALYQQNPGGLCSFKIREEHFPRMDIKDLSGVPLVLSVDPGGAGGRSNSYCVIQVWARINEHHVLVDQWREQANIGEMRARLTKMMALRRPAVVLIEKAGCGEELIRLARAKALGRVVSVTPNGRSKAERLYRYRKIIRSRRIVLRDDADWVDEFIDEFTRFPNAAFDDQVDAFTQYADFMDDNPVLQVPPSPAIGANALASCPLLVSTTAPTGMGSDKGLAVVATSRGTFRA
jgi:predicted phage terminase large subunit-like protein